MLQVCEKTLFNEKGNFLKRCRMHVTRMSMELRRLKEVMALGMEVENIQQGSLPDLDLCIEDTSLSLIIFADAVGKSVVGLTDDWKAT